MKNKNLESFNHKVMLENCFHSINILSIPACGQSWFDPTHSEAVKDKSAVVSTLFVGR